MSKMDGTGPMGQGPMTGHRLGPCGYGMGYGRGMGIDWGWRRFFRSPKNQLKALEEEEQMLLAELEEVRAEIAELKGSK